jgi:ABC-type phosphate/phosphonate transport system substrate-binding protein
MNLFVIDDNDGAVRWGDRGQLDVKVSWLSNTQLLVQYPAKARVFKQETSYQATTVQYAPSQ